MAFPNANDVPEICDLIINGERYMYATDEQNKAAFSYTQPFVQRVNTDPETDDKENWWLAWNQTDWSGGEGQRYQARTAEDANRFWRGKNVDIRQEGDVILSTVKSDVTFAAAPRLAIGGHNRLVWYATSTNLYSINESGTISDKGAHGLGATPSRFASALVNGATTDIFLSGTTAGTVGVRRYNGTAFATYSATGADALAFLNNALYGYSKSTGQFMRYTPGAVPVAAVEVFTWRNPEGAAITGIEAKLLPMGGKMAILRHRGSGQRTAGELWIYDGTAAPSLVAEFPINFEPYDMEIKSGTVFITGAYQVSNNQIATILFYKDGVVGELWRAEQGMSTSALPAIAAWESGLVFSDPVGYPGTSLERLVYYNEEKGSFSTLIELADVVGTSPCIASCSEFFLVVPSTSAGTTGYQWGISTTPNSSGEIDTPFIDFNSTLRKLHRGITVEFEDDPSELTSSIDIKYAFDGSNTYTTLQSDASPGVEYKIPGPSEGTTYDSVSVRVVLNKGSGGALIGPRLKRIKVRSIPVGRNSLAKRVYRIQLIGKDGEGHVLFYNGETAWKDGKQMHADLRTAASKTMYFAVTDTMGSYNAVIEEMKVVQIRKDEFIAEITFREV